MSESPTPSDAVPTDASRRARAAAATLLGLLTQKRAHLSFRYERRYMITPAASDDPMIFITIDSDGAALPGDAIVVTSEGEFNLTRNEMNAITDAIRDEEVGD
jgi:hypothetical protein